MVGDVWTGSVSLATASACEKAGVAAATALERPNASIPLFQRAKRSPDPEAPSWHASWFRGRRSPRGIITAGQRRGVGNEVRLPISSSIADACGRAHAGK